MKEKIFEFIFCLLCIISMIFIFNHNNEVATIILEAINLFFTKVFVSLFPMFILNDLLINLGFPYYFYYLFNKLFKTIFKTSGLCAYVFIMSLISGTPSNAYILKNLVLENKLTNEEASHYLAFTYFSNPLFLLLMLSPIFSPTTTFKIILIHYLSNIIIGIILRPKAPLITNLSISKNNQEKISSTLIKSIKRSINTLLIILGTIVFYMLLSYIITNLISINKTPKIIFTSFLEITNGLKALTNYQALPKIKEIIAVATISFGGLSINTQIKSILEDTNIDYKCFLKGRIFHVIISILLIILI